jgi:chromosome segregation ATPase
MKTVEELEALVETLTRERDVETNSALMFESDWKDACRERDELRAWQLQVAEPIGFVLRAFGVGGYDVAEPAVLVNAWRALERERDLSLSAWEAAGMTGRTAQSAMLELARQLEEARQDLDAVNAVLEDINWLEDERDKARAWAHQSERERDEAREAIVALTTAKAEADLEIATLTAALDERDVEAERGLEQYDRLMRERDELLVRVANQDAELRATREAYNGARAEVERLRREVDAMAAELHALSVKYDANVHDTADAYRRGAEAMREACARVADAHCVPGTRDVIRAMSIPEEP